MNLFQQLWNDLKQGKGLVPKRRELGIGSKADNSASRNKYWYGEHSADPVTDDDPHGQIAQTKIKR